MCVPAESLTLFRGECLVAETLGLVWKSMSKQTVLTLIGFSVPLKYCRYVINLPQLEAEFEFEFGLQAICLSAVADHFFFNTWEFVHVNCGSKLNLKRETLKAHSHLASMSAFAFSKIIEAMVTKHKRRKWVLYPFSASTSTSP